MIEAVLTGIKSKVDATSGDPLVHNAFYLAIGGRWYETEAPELATLPYAVITALPVTSRATFDSTVYSVPLTINLFSDISTDAPSEIDDIFDAFKTLMYPTTGGGWIAISVSGYTQVKFEPVSTYRQRYDDCWAYAIDMVWEGQES